MEYQYYHIIEQLEKRGSSPGLEQIRMLLEKLGNPERKLQMVHIAGTNGKGSVFAFLSSILEEGGYRVGRYISPTIKGYEERFQINGRQIEPEKLEKYYLLLEKVLKEMGEEGERGPTLFEVETALSFLYFAEEKTDVALIETGLGGTFDATNIIEHPLVSVISSISFDHKTFLGDTLEQIAAQKGGIIKEGVPVVLAENPPEVCQVIEETAKEKRASCVNISSKDYAVKTEMSAGSTFIWKERQFETVMPGRHQISNAVTALTAAEILREQYGFSRIGVSQMQEGIKKTVWPGRLEILRKEPLVYRDGAHNPDGARKLAQFLEKHFTNKKIIYIMGVLKDKEYDKMLAELIPLANKAFVFKPKGERGLPGELLAAQMKPFGIQAVICKNVNEALKKALAQADKEDILVVCGSLSFMADMEVEIWK